MKLPFVSSHLRKVRLLWPPGSVMPLYSSVFASPVSTRNEARIKDACYAATVGGADSGPLLIGHCLCAQLYVGQIWASCRPHVKPHWRDL